MGEKVKEALRVQFDKRLRLEFHGAEMGYPGGFHTVNFLSVGIEKKGRDTASYLAWRSKIKKQEVSLGNHCTENGERTQALAAGIR
jgi:hypothetical protein